MKEQTLNLTRLDPYQQVVERGIIHRDQFAHMARWWFVGKLIKLNQTILDVGAGKGDLAWTLYVNRLKPRCYCAIDLNSSHIRAIDELATKVNFPVFRHKLDIRFNNLPYLGDDFDIVTCFEVVEHFEDKYIDFVLGEMKRVVKPKGVVLLSTPNYDGIHKAKNHVHEYTEKELREHLVKHFDIKAMYGTFMSLGRPNKAKSILTPGDYNLFMKLYPYYNSSVLSVMFAPAYPKQSRNILWILKKK